MAKAADYLSQSGVEQSYHQPRPAQGNALLHGRVPPFAERGTDRRIPVSYTHLIQSQSRSVNVLPVGIVPHAEYLGIVRVIDVEREVIARHDPI